MVLSFIVVSLLLARVSGWSLLPPAPMSMPKNIVSKKVESREHDASLPSVRLCWQDACYARRQPFGRGLVANPSAILSVRSTDGCKTSAWEWRCVVTQKAKKCRTPYPAPAMTSTTHAPARDSNSAKGATISHHACLAPCRPCC